MSDIIFLNGINYDPLRYKVLLRFSNRWEFRFLFNYKNNEEFSLLLQLPISKIQNASLPSFDKYIINTYWNEETCSSIAIEYNCYIEASSVVVKYLSIILIDYDNINQRLFVEVESVIYDDYNNEWLNLRIVTAIDYVRND